LLQTTRNNSTIVASATEQQDPQHQQQQRYGQQHCIADNDYEKMPTGEIGVKATTNQLQ